LKITYLLILFFSIFSYSNTNITIGESDIYIESKRIEINKENNEIYFKDMLKIKNEYILISGSNAVFNKQKKILNISGNKVNIFSNSSENIFSGSAKTIFIYADNSIELSGDAVFENDGIKFKSSSIKFNQQNGKILE
jgi:lipopolysaccharide export system protein LptA|tara:strand:- start:2709 stop:3122 length:414 start_codon:yes stop_codon:yes gene_type:complete